MDSHRVKNLEAARIRYQQLKREGKVAKLNPIDKAKNNPNSLRMAVNAKCYDCCGGENWVNRTRYCSIFGCPLWPVRPHSKGISRQQCLDWKEPGVK